MVIGDCPVCKEGKLRMIRSRKTGKRFVGCTNYSKGCRASAPLPQRGTVKGSGKVCSHCGWPIVYVRLGRFPWRLCVNVNCETKEKRKIAVQSLQKKS
jgi:DNA topoisomerase I